MAGRLEALHVEHVVHEEDLWAAVVALDLALVRHRLGHTEAVPEILGWSADHLETWSRSAPPGHAADESSRLADDLREILGSRRLNTARLDRPARRLSALAELFGEVLGPGRAAGDSPVVEERRGEST